MKMFVTFRNKIFKFFYKRVLRPLLFLFDPESVHDTFIFFGRILGTYVVTRKLTAVCFNYQNSILEQTIYGLKFKNPVGLAAGFDKEAYLTGIAPSIGFGFEEVGSITAKPCVGNPRPRLWRLPQAGCLAVYYGLKNQGAQNIATRLKKQKFFLPLGINLAKTNSPVTDDIEAAVADYLSSYKTFLEIADYFTINISCPNTSGGEPFLEAANLEKLLTELDKFKTSKAVLLKLSPDLSEGKLDAILETVRRHRVEGFICSNLTTNRQNRKLEGLFVPPKGGLSGKVLEDLANRQIGAVYRKTQGRYLIVGCGGIFNAADAYKKIRLGASLLQLVTGMVYEGPQVVGEINLGLVKFLKRDGFANIAEAVGVDSR